MFVAQLWDFHPRLMDVVDVAASLQFGVPGVPPVLYQCCGVCTIWGQLWLIFHLPVDVIGW